MATYYYSVWERQLLIPPTHLQIEIQYVCINIFLTRVSIHNSTVIVVPNLLQYAYRLYAKEKRINKKEIYSGCTHVIDRN